MKKIAVIIAAYNPEKYLKTLFSSLNNLNYLKQDFKVFVINDNPNNDIFESLKCLSEKMKFCLITEDDAVQKNKKTKKQSFDRAQDRKNKEIEISLNEEMNWMNVTLIQNKKNLGFAGTNNVGIRRALKEKYEYIILLNQDMEVDKNWLGELVKKVELSDKLGIVQAMMMLYKSRDIIYSTGDRLNYLGIGYSENCGVPLDKYDSSKSVMSYAGGAAVLFRADVLKEVGLFDESFFMYHEDSDLSWRIRMAGYDIALARDAVCYHDYEFKGRSKMVFYWTEKNRLALLLKNFEIKTLVLIFPMFIIMEFGMMAYALATGWLPEKLNAYDWFLKNLKQILKSRKRVQKLRKVRDRELKKYLVAEIEFSGLENPLLRYVANPILKLYWAMVGWLI